MEVFETDQYYIFVKNDKSLWWNRKTSEFQTKCGWDLSSVDDIECIGITYGIIGTVKLPTIYSPHLVIIKDAVPVGVLYPPHLIYKIKSICLLSDEKPDSVLIHCPKHNTNKVSAANTNISQKQSIFEGSLLVNKTWGAVKIAGNTIRTTTQQAAAIASNQVKSSISKNNKSSRNVIKEDKKISDEIHKIFDDTDSFYYCLDNDITNNLQRQKKNGNFDERFFWNMHMLKDILKFNDAAWILPVMQGFVQVEQCVIGNECFTLAIVSRRSRHRAGTRYKRRGVDEEGNVANFVETEQILSFHHHQISFTQIRGSVPVYWSQPGYKYRPPPQIDRDELETHASFEKHFENDLKIYQSICVINLVEQSGKEKIIFDAFTNHILKYNNDKLTYVTFDFHEYCRGMKFENVATLIEAIKSEAGAMRFHWRDKNGIICEQTSIFRINCMDCLDRTNVVETALAKLALESQLVKLGISPPYASLPDQIKIPFMQLWANNGDVISKQYAGTNALKGDYTRTGERKLTGIMKDGMNSANRYYLARFKDAYRQATTDLMLGNQVSAESLTAFGNQACHDDLEGTENAEHAKLLIEDCRKLLLGSTQHPLGAWGLIDAHPSTGDPNETEVDNILLLTEEYYIVAEYESALDKIVKFLKVFLEQISSVEFGSYQQSKLFQGNSVNHLCIRINYVNSNGKEQYHIFRSSNLRFFNNVAVVIRTNDEIMESLNAIVECFRIALESSGRLNVPFFRNTCLQRRKSNNINLDIPKGMPRNLSESQLVQAGSKAMSNVAGQLSKIGQTFNRPSNKNVTNIKKSEETNSIAQGDTLLSPAITNVDSNVSSDSEELDSSIYEPVSINLMKDSVSKDNYFLPSVGIVMSAGTEQPNSQNPLSSLQSTTAKSTSMNNGPEIIINYSLNKMKPDSRLENQKHSNSASNIDSVVTSHNPEMFLNLAGSQSDNALKQLKTLTSPLSKFAKGVQNFGSNLDPRKITNKTGVTLSSSTDLLTINSEPSTESNKLSELWIEKKCRTKLIAL